MLKEKLNFYEISLQKSGEWDLGFEIRKTAAFYGVMERSGEKITKWKKAFHIRWMWMCNQ